MMLMEPIVARHSLYVVNRAVNVSQKTLMKLNQDTWYNIWQLSPLLLSGGVVY